MIDHKIFKTVISSTPLISIDLLVKKDNKILLGKRINKPAQDYLFSIGGRVYKNETINSAMMRIAKDELNIELNQPLSLLVFLNIFMMTVFIKMYQHTMLTWLMRLKLKRRSTYQPNSIMNINGSLLMSY